MRPEKESIVKEVAGKLTESDYAIFADYSGLTVEQLRDLRTLLSLYDTEIYIAKNSFINAAMVKMGCNDMSDIIKGPTAMISGSGDITQVAKVLKKFIIDNDKLVINGGRVDSKLLSSDDVAVLADIPAREILLGILVGTIAAPMSQLVGVMNQKVLSLLYVLKAIEEKKGGK